MIPSRPDQSGVTLTAPECVQQDILHQGELSRIFRSTLPCGAGIVCKEFLGPNALTAQSAGAGKGATFILEIPVLPEKIAAGSGVITRHQ